MNMNALLPITTFKNWNNNNIDDRITANQRDKTCMSARCALLSLSFLAVRAPTNHNPHHTQIKSLKTMKFIEENCRRILSIVKILNTHLVHIIHGLALDCNRCSADIQKVTRIIISSEKFLISVRFFFCGEYYVSSRRLDRSLPHAHTSNGVSS